MRTESGFRKLKIWRKGMEIAEESYVLTRRFPKEEKFGLQSQIRRASISIPSNVAEGYSRKSKKEFKQFLYIALGSLGELETQVILVRQLNLINQADHLLEKIDHERSMILKLCNQT